MIVLFFVLFFLAHFVAWANKLHTLCAWQTFAYANRHAKWKELSDNNNYPWQSVSDIEIIFILRRLELALENYNRLLFLLRSFRADYVQRVAMLRCQNIRKFIATNKCRAYIVTMLCQRTFAFVPLRTLNKCQRGRIFASLEMLYADKCQCSGRYSDRAQRIH